MTDDERDERDARLRERAQRGYSFIPNTTSASVIGFWLSSDNVVGHYRAPIIGWRMDGDGSWGGEPISIEELPEFWVIEFPDADEWGFVCPGDMAFRSLEEAKAEALSRLSERRGKKP